MTQGENFPRYHLNSRYRALDSYNGLTRTSLLVSGNPLRGDHPQKPSVPSHQPGIL